METAFVLLGFYWDDAEMFIKKFHLIEKVKENNRKIRFTNPTQPGYAELSF